MAPFVPSVDLEKIVGPAARPRTVFLEAVMKYVQTNGLQDRGDPKIIRTDSTLRKVCAGKKSVSIFELPQLIGVQLTPAKSESDKASHGEKGPKQVKGSASRSSSPTTA